MDDLEKLADLYLDMLRRRDTRRAAELFAENVRWHFGAGLVGAGIDAWRELVDAWLAAFPDLTPGDADVLIDAATSSFAVRMAWSATHMGPFMGVPATGRSVANAGVSLFKVVDGRVVEEWIFEDTANLLRQLQG